MAQLHKLEGQVEVNCIADKVFKVILEGQSVPNACSDKIPNVEAYQLDCTSVGSTTKWDFVIDGSPHYFIERIEAVDEKNRIIHRDSLDGDMMKTCYKSLATKMQFVPKGDNCCTVKFTIEYEKLNDNAPEPHNLLEFALGVLRDLGSYLSSA